MKSLLPIVKDLLKDEWRVKVQAVKVLHNITYQAKREDIKLMFGSIADPLRALINDVWA